MTYSCAIFSRGATNARGGAGGQARADLPEARAQARPARARRRLAAGARSRSTPRKRHGVHVTGITRLAPAGRDARAAAPRRRASPTASTSASPTTASSPASRTTRSPRSGWSSTSAPSRWTSTRGACAARCGRARRCSSTASPTCARRTRKPGRILRPLRLPRRRAAAALARAARRSSARTSRRTTSRTSAPTTRRRCATGRARLDENVEEAIRHRGPRARARVAAVPAGGAQRLRDRLHLDLSGPRLVIGEASSAFTAVRAVESEHRVAWATTDRGRAGRARAAGVNRRPTRPVDLRPLRGQAVPGARRACAPACPSASSLCTEHLAMACASHGGSEGHILRVREMLRAAGRSEADLACGPGEPRDPAAAIALREAGDQPRAGEPQLLGQARLRARVRDGRGLADGGLHRQGPPAPGRDGERDGEATRVEPGELARATDGCGMRTFSVPMARLAAAFGRLASGGLGSGGRAARRAR